MYNSRRKYNLRDDIQEPKTTLDVFLGLAITVSVLCTIGILFFRY